MSKILDYGCGRGYFTHYLASKGNEVYGVDISEENIEYGRKHFPEVKYVLSSALPLQFEDGFFDEIYLMDVLEHVDDLHATLTEVTRLLTKGGKLTINVPA
jgi:2-polyprenyl-3-methyl-5-hydroxy-6-metoxy-1,4-benzoquinol methylase